MKAIDLQRVALIGVLCFTISSVSYADVLRVPGVFTEVADRVEGSAITILDFDLPGLRQGEGLEVASATISWDHAGLTDQKTVRYRLFDSTEQGSRSLHVLSSRTTLEEVIAGEPISSGSFYPQDYRRIGKGHISLDVLTQVRGLIERHQNHLQVLVVTEDMSPASLGAGAEAVPVLVIRYGFLGGMKSALSLPD